MWPDSALLKVATPSPHWMWCANWRSRSASAPICWSSIKRNRGPDDDLKLQFEAITRLEPEERRIIKELIEGMIIKYESRRWNKAAV